MILALCFSFSTTITYAYQEKASNSINQEVLALVSSLDIIEELQDARDGIIDANICKEVIDSISITSNDDSDVLYTIKHLGIITKDNGVKGEVYALTASTKTTTNEITKDYVECWISMTWIDNFGPANEIVSVSGGWRSNGRILSNRQVFYGIVSLDGHFVDGKYEDRFPNTNSFYYTPSTSLVGLSLCAYSWVNSAGYPYSILCEVQPTIFD